MADFRFPLNPSGGGTAFGWTGPSKSELQRQNEARIQANLLLERGGTMEDVLAIPNLGIGDVENLKKGLQASQERWGQTIKAMQPSSELTGQEQLGPVQQAPTFDWMRQFDQPPTMLSNAVFQQPTATMMPPGLQTPGRATWGAEALYPQGGFPQESNLGPMGEMQTNAITTPSLGFGEGSRQYPMFEAARGQVPSIGFPPAQEEIGGATAYAPPPPPPDVIPEYLRRPQTTEAPPPPPDTFVPGGQRMPIPGRTLSQLMLDRPELGEFAMANLPKLQAAEAEYQGNQAVQGYVQDVRVNGMSEEDALRKWGAGLDQSPLGQKVANAARERLAQQTTARATAVTARKTEADIAETQRKGKLEQDAQQFALNQAAEARASGDERGARLWEARARDPRFADQLIKEQELAQKETDPTAQRTLRDAAIYQLQQEGTIAPSPGQIAQRAFELSQKTDAASSEQTIRQAATKRLMDRGNQKPTELEIAAEAINVKKELRPEPSTTTVTMGFPERKETATHQNMVTRIQGVLRELDEGQSENVGGAFGLNTKVTAVLDVIYGGEQSRANQAFRARVRTIGADYMKLLTGAAVGEDVVYKAATPNVDRDSLGDLYGKLEAIEANTQRLLEYEQALRAKGEWEQPPSARSIPPPKPVAPRFGGKSAEKPLTAEEALQAVGAGKPKAP